MSFVLTRNGDRFDAGDPESFIPDIVSAARTLARIPRFNGHHDHDYSVAHHSIAGAWALQEAGYPAAALLFLVHDAHETILGDIPSPLKRHLGRDFMEYEKRLESHFMAALAGPVYRNVRARRLSKIMDQIIVAAEAQCLGLDDGWTVQREEDYEHQAFKDQEGPWPSLALIRHCVEETLLMRDPHYVAGLLVTMYQDLHYDIG